jgi:hypothetical protein
MSRSNEELNLSVLRRHYPDVITVLNIAAYAVLYSFSPTTSQWEKTGIEGTLFVCALAPSEIGSERFSVVILNRRGLENFEAELGSADDVEVTDEYVILKGEDEDGGPIIYGLWIFAEPPPSSTAHAREKTAAIIEECARRADESQQVALEAQEQMLRENGQQEQGQGNGYIAEESETEESVPMGRQLSLRELFGRQREMDHGFSVHHHESPAMRVSQPPQQYPVQIQQPAPMRVPAINPVEEMQERHEQPLSQVPTPQFSTTADTDFFRSGPRFAPKQDQQNGMRADNHPPDSGNMLEDLFRKARAGQQQ